MAQSLSATTIIINNQYLTPFLQKMLWTSPAPKHTAVAALDGPAVNMELFSAREAELSYGNTTPAQAEPTPHWHSTHPAVLLASRIWYSYLEKLHFHFFPTHSRLQGKLMLQPAVTLD